MTLHRADAWDLSGRAAPSPRGYVRLVDRWSARHTARLRRTVEEVRRRVGEPEGEDGELSPGQANQAARLIVGAIGSVEIEPPTPEQIAAVGRPVARRGVMAEHRALVRAGMPRRMLTDAYRATRRRGDAMRGDRSDALETGIDLIFAGLAEPLLDEWSAAGVGLIRTMTTEQTRDLPARAVRALVEGRRWESLVEGIERSGASSRAHARLIARDQVARLNGEITQEMHRSAGVDEYVWLTSNDERVRESHRAVDGQTFSWESDGAPGVGFYGESGHPGRSGQCRCRARPVPPPDMQWAARPIRKATYREAA